MIERDIRSRGVADERVLAALRAVPREDFVLPEDRAEAYGDHPLPIGFGQTISQPYIVAKMTEALALSGSECVLEIGTGSGYQAAVLSRLARTVHTVERIPALHRAAKARLVRYENVRVHLADGTEGLEAHSPYDAILVAAQSNEVPPALVRQSALGGRIVIPLGDRSSQELVLLVRSERGGAWTRTRLDDVRFVPLRSGGIMGP